MKRSLSLLLAAAMTICSFPALNASAEETAAPQQTEDGQTPAPESEPEKETEQQPEEEYHATGELEPEFQLPDWVPKDFNEALIFQNTYGATHIEGNVVCIVKQVTKSEDYSFKNSLEHTGENSRVRGSQEYYDFHAPVPPEDVHSEEYEEYERLCSELGWYAQHMTDAENYDPGYRYCVCTYELENVAEFKFIWETTFLRTNEQLAPNVLTFAALASGGYTETDINGWLPDCPAEYDAFVKENGTISLHDNYIVYADDVCYDGGYSLVEEQSGTGLLERIAARSPQHIYVLPPCGGMSHVLRVYEAKRTGTVLMDWKIMREFSPNGADAKSKKQAYAVGADGKITVIEESAVQPLVAGDCNNDGKYAVEDLVAMQKYLLGEGELGCWQNVDFNNDSRIDAADFTIFKQLYLDYLTMGCTEDMPLGTDIMLTTPWTEKGLGGKTEFTVVFSSRVLANFDVARIRLYEKNGGEAPLAELKKNEDGLYSCEAALEITEEGTHTYYVSAEGNYGKEKINRYFRSNEVTIDFREMPAPVAG